VNLAASFGNAMLQNPGADAALFGGLLLMNVGADMEPPAVVADATGVGAIVGVPVNVLGAAAIVGGGYLAIGGATTLWQSATSDCSRTVMHMRSPESSSGGGKPTNAPNSGGRMIGENGPEINSKSWDGTKWRLDIENPAPGDRPAQMHVKYDGYSDKIQYDFGSEEFSGMPKWMREKLNKDPKFADAVEKGLKYLGEGG